MRFVISHRFESRSVVKGVHEGARIDDFCSDYDLIFAPEAFCRFWTLQHGAQIFRQAERWVV